MNRAPRMAPPRRPYFDAPPIALAHRGGSAYGPNRGLENTAAAFRRAIELGYRYVETDVHATADGRVLAFHDTSLDRVSDGSGLIGALPWSEVSQARVGASEPIPLLSDLLEEFPETRVNIDIKAYAALRPLWDVIRAHAAYDRVCVGSFSTRTLWTFRRLSGGRVATAAGQVGTATMRFVPGVVDRWLHTPADVLQVPTACPVFGRNVTVVTPELLRRAHRHGKQVHVWTIDDADDMNRLLDLGVDGIVSDAIDVLRDVLIARNAWH